MMVERTPYIGMGQFITELDKATAKLHAINSSQSSLSTEELNDLIEVFEKFNTTLDPAYWGDKKFASEGVNQKIEKALIAIQLFQRCYPSNDRSGQRNIDQAITSLFSALDSTLSRFDKNIRDLKKYKIGHRVEKISESNQA